MNSNPTPASDREKSLSEKLVAAAAEAMASVPDTVLASARLHLLDSLGVGILGSVSGPVRTVTSIADSAGHGPCTVLGRSDGSPAPVAALANGALIHSLEFDDTHVASVMHGSSTLTSAALAAAEANGADGDRMTAAYVIGWEVLIRMGLASPGTLQARGFQTTSAAGPFVAALVSILMRGDTHNAADALGIAGSQPGGTFAFLAEGATVKAAQPAWAAHSGLWAAELARAGITGPSRVLDGDHGFYTLFADDPGAPDRLGALLDDLGEKWHLPDAAYKLIPCCHFIHPFVEAVEQLLSEGLRPADIDSLHCHVPVGAAPVIAEPWGARQSPPTGHDARWSLPYVLAARLVDGEVRNSLFTDPIGGERAAVAGRMTYELWDDSGFPARYPARIDARTTDGRVLTATVRDVLGGAGRPVPEEAIRAKADRNLRLAGWTADEAAGLIELLVDTQSLDLPALSALLRGAAGAGRR